MIYIKGIKKFKTQICMTFAQQDILYHHYASLEKILISLASFTLTVNVSGLFTAQDLASFTPGHEMSKC